MVETTCEIGEFVIQCGDPGGVVGDVPVHRDGRTVAGLEVVAEVLRRPELIDAHGVPGCHDVGDVVAEQRPDVFLATPQWRGLRAGGGGGAYGFIVANIWPMKPSGVQLSRPIVPPGRQTRTSSSALA